MKKLVVTAVSAVLAILVTPLQAAVVFNESIDFDLQVFVDCANGGAGELVDLKGPLHSLVTFTINGNRISGKIQDQPQGISGVGMVTGERYQATGGTQSSFKGSFNNGQFSETYVNNFRIIGQGPGNNFLVHENYHLTVNANGDVSSSHDNVSVECK